jgi:hypothetical protein
VHKEPQVGYGDHIRFLAKEFYKIFPDDIEMMFFTTFYEPASGGAGAIGGPTEWNTKGVIFGDEEFGNNGEFGSDGALESLVQYFKGNETNDGVTLHEIFHKWGVAFDPVFNLTNGQHFTNNLMTEVSAGMGGTNYTDIEDLGNGLYKYIAEPDSYGKYGSLDMYIAGYINIDEVKWPIKVLVDPVYEYMDSDNNRVFSSVNDIQLITKEIWLNSMGPRIPSYLETKRVHEVACISMSYDPLSPHEMRYWHEIAKNHQIDRITGLEDNTTFVKSTRGVASLDTRLTPIISSISDERKENESIVISNPVHSALHFTQNLLDQDYTFRMYNSAGHFVLTDHVQQRVSIHSLPTGLYFLFLDSSEKSNLYQQKVVIVH